MTLSAEAAWQARVLFVAAAGPRRGFGDLVRCISFARALGVRPLIAVHGGRRLLESGLGLGADVIPRATPRTIGLFQPEVVFVDEPVAVKARRWIAAARRAGALVVMVHELEIGCRESARVVIELAGGPRLRLASAIANAIVAGVPGVEVRIAGGFVVAPRPLSSNVVWIGASRGIAAELEESSGAVVGGVARASAAVVAMSIHPRRAPW